MDLTESQLDTLRDLEKFAPKFLVISTKGGGAALPFTFNRAQKYLHQRLQKQLKNTGKVRAVILKSRQMGCSTYIQARYFHRVITSQGKKAFILTHDKEATKNLFNMATKFYENLDEGLVPKPDTANAKELYFKEMDSGYSVGTAGNKTVGRGQTIQLFHGCLAKGSQVFNPDDGGLKNIENFNIGDNVLTHRGFVAPISYISTQQKECLKIILRGLTYFPLIATPDHKFYTKEGWKKLKDFKDDDVIGYPIKIIEQKYKSLKLPLATTRAHGGGRQFICPDKIKIDYKLGRIVGLYLAEGHIKLQNKEPCHPSHIEFSVHRNELGRAIKWLAPFHKYFSSMKTNDREDCLTSSIIIYGNRFAMLINDLCGRTKNKHLPLNWNELGENFCRGLLHGYISGDGHSNENDRRIVASSICSAITISMRDLVASLGYGWASIQFKKGAIRYGRNEKDTYIFNLCGNGASQLAKEIGKPTPEIKRIKTNSIKNNAAKTTEISNGYAWLRIREINNIGLKHVYDFEINHEDHSYCVIQGSSSNSEVAFWSFAEDHTTGILQAISDSSDTEVILESTANGIGNYFHERWLSAMGGYSEYQAIFMPWYWMNEYKFNAENLILTEEEEYLLKLYSADGLTKEHLAWRRNKIQEFSKDWDAGLERYTQEYPICASEAFKNPIQNIFIPSKYVTKARANRVEGIGRLIIGVDPAGSGADKTAIIRRRGHLFYNHEQLTHYEPMEICGYIKRMILKESPWRVYVDCIGIGAGIVDRMHEMGFDCVEGVNVARSANEKDKFVNLRAELWSDFRDFLMGEMNVQIPDDDEMHGQICSLGYKYNSNGQLKIESKDDLRARGMASPDIADAACLCMFSGSAEGFYHLESPPLRPGENTMFR